MSAPRRSRMRLQAVCPACGRLRSAKWSPDAEPALVVYTHRAPGPADRPARCPGSGAAVTAERGAA